MSTVIATAEKLPIVPNTPTNSKELRDELAELSNKLHAVHNLGAYRAALNYVGELKERSSKYFLMHYDFELNKVLVTGFAANASKAANLAYTRAESNKKANDNIVLVSVGSLRSLMRAYPNYFLDTHQFTELLKQTLKGA